MGDKLDRKNAATFQAGGFVSMPANMNHYAWATSETIVQVHGEGPFEIAYVSPADDPMPRSTLADEGDHFRPILKRAGFAVAHAAQRKKSRHFETVVAEADHPRIGGRQAAAYGAAGNPGGPRNNGNSAAAGSACFTGREQASVSFVEERSECIVAGPVGVLVDHPAG